MSAGYTRENAVVFDGYGEDVKVGDKITILAMRLNVDGRPMDVGTERSDIRRGAVTSVDITNGLNQRGFAWHAAKYGELGWLTGEGVRWIRGWHRTDSIVVAALLAAARLDRSAA